MLASAIPYKFKFPWGLSALPNMINYPIPETASGGNASQAVGYPPITAAPVGSGGIPPNVADENGAHFYETLWLQWIQAGAPVPYDATFSTNIGGYPNGAIIQSTAGTYHWQSTVDNNTTNPNAGGANWVRYEGGSFPRRFLSVSANTAWTGANVGSFVTVSAAATTQTITTSAFVGGDTIGFSAGQTCTITLSSGNFQGAPFTGLSSITLPAQSWIAFQFDGTNWRIFTVSPSAFPASITNPGYEIHSNGLIVQWGTTSLLAHNASQTIALPVPFTSAGFTISATPIVGVASENGQSASAIFLNTGTITVSNTGASSGISFGVYWEARGK